MSIGSVLAEARERAGLSVAEVSTQTRIKVALIRAIERDDFAACGGDFYARGHIRAIARVVGIDSLPLISEFDTVRPGVRPVTIDDHAGAAGPEPDPEPDSAPGPEAPGIGTEDSILNPAAFGPAASAEPAAGTDEGRQHTKPGPVPWRLAPIALAGLAVIGIGVYRVSAGTGSSPAPPTAVAKLAPAATPVSSHSPTAPRSPSQSPSASPSHSQSASLTTVQPRSAAAYGPGGTSSGDNPQHASQALSGHSGSPWQSQRQRESVSAGVRRADPGRVPRGHRGQAREGGAGRN